MVSISHYVSAGLSHALRGQSHQDLVLLGNPMKVLV